MRPPVVDLDRLTRRLEDPELRAVAPAAIAEAHAALAGARRVETGTRTLLVQDGDAVGVVQPHGAVTLYRRATRPAACTSLRHRLLELDRAGHLILAIQRDPTGALGELWVRDLEGGMVGLLPGGASHPTWGPSDRIVRRARGVETPPEPVTIGTALRWEALDAIPAVAEPARLPPGAGSALLNALAALAEDQAVTALRYRGPYPTEQLFWSLVEAFRFDPTAPDPLSAFLARAEETFVRGEPREAALDWQPAPHERLFLDDGNLGVYVQLRHGVEKIAWQGRTYYRDSWHGLGRHEARVVRPVTEPSGGPGFAASLWALDAPVEDHLIVAADGRLVACPARGREPMSGPDTPATPAWTEALASLLPLEATPLLGTGIGAVWPGLRLVWGTVPWDLVAVEGVTLRLAHALAAHYQSGAARRPADARRALALRLVRDVLGLVGPPVRAAAAAWLEAQPAPRQAALLDGALRVDRRALAEDAARTLDRLVAALAGGEAMPPARPPSPGRRSAPSTPPRSASRVQIRGRSTRFHDQEDAS